MVQYQPPNALLTHPELIRSAHKKDITPFNKDYTPLNWCNYTSPTASVFSLPPKAQPWGVFLICGD